MPRYDAAVAQGIRPHVDQGAFSVNCWLTPDSDLAPRRRNDTEGSNGGLRLFRGSGVEGAALAEALFAQGGRRRSTGETAGAALRRANQDFRSLRAVIEAATARGAARAVDVAYQQNRCVVFESGLLHETSPAMRFKPGYRRRRINLTFMFGNTDGFGANEESKAE